ncbi:MAG: class I SAM-dependent methyltransferase [Bryobacter sp.]|nr:class I SAM-dependent methyltransferase [Bryobacter sp.]
MNQPEHWNQIYRQKTPQQMSWTRSHLDLSLAWIERSTPDRTAHILDVGAGVSTLCDDLWERGYRNLSVLDLAPAAMEQLGQRTAGRVTCLVGDVTTFPFAQGAYDLWHDRAVFHFLTDPAARAAYVRQVEHALRPGGHILIATFGPQGPEKCSGLPVVRYTPEQLHEQFGPGFQFLGSHSEMHTTPFGTEQQFVYCFCSLAQERLGQDIEV